MKADRILAELDDARTALARVEDEAARLREYIGTLELAAKLAGASLTSIRTNRIVSSVQVQAKVSADTKRAAGRATRTGEAQRLLYERDWDITRLAKHLGETRPRVSKWFGPPSDNRPIPRAIAERLQRELGIPVTAWSRVAK